MNEFQMRIQDLTTQIQRLESKNQQDLLEQKLQLEKEHIVNLLFQFDFKFNLFLFINRIN